MACVVVCVVVGNAEQISNFRRWVRNRLECGYGIARLISGNELSCLGNGDGNILRQPHLADTAVVALARGGRDCATTSASSRAGTMTAFYDSLRLIGSPFLGASPGLQRPTGSGPSSPCEKSLRDGCG